MRRVTVNFGRPWACGGGRSAKPWLCLRAPRRSAAIGCAAVLALAGAPGGKAAAQLQLDGEAQVLRPAEPAGPAAGGEPAGPRNVIPWLEEAINAAEGAAPVTAPEAGSGAGAPASSGGFVGEDGRRIGEVLGGAEGAPSPGVLTPAGASAPGASAPGASATGRPALGRPVASEPAPFELQPPASGATAPASLGGPSEAVQIAPIDAVRAAAAGVVSAASLGLPVDAWRGSNATDAAEVVDSLTPGPLRAANALAIDLLSAAFEPPAATPAGLGAGRDLLTARLDALARFGAVDRVVELAESAGAARLAKAGDAAFVGGLEQRVCGAILAERGADPLEQAFCLSVVGDPIGAQLAISANRSLGVGDDATLLLLEAVADPSLIDVVTPPTSIRETTPLRLGALRRLGLAAPADFSRLAPLELLPAATHRAAPPRQRLEALERLEPSGAISSDALRAAFLQSASAESGGVWGRVEAFRAAIGAPPGRFAVQALRALDVAREAGREEVMARLLSAEAESRLLSPGNARASTSETRRLLWLGGRWKAAAQVSGVDAQIEDRALAAITADPIAGFGRRAGGDLGLAQVGVTGWVASDAEPLFARAARGDERAARLAAGLLAIGVPTDNPSFFEAAPELAFAEREGRLGEIAFGAVASLGGDAPVTGAAVFAALSNLMAVGLEDAARAIAVEAALLP